MTTTSAETPTPPQRRARWSAPLAGVASGALALGVAEALAAISGATGPVIALGDRVIDLTPPAVKDWAIETFGFADKLVLISSILLVAAVLLAGAGILGARRRIAGLTVLVILSGVAAAAMVAAREEPGVPVGSVAALAAGLLLGGAAFWWLLDRRPAAAGVASQEAPAPPGFDRRAFLAVAAGMTATGAAAGWGVPRIFPTATGRGGVRIPTAADPAPPIPRGAKLDVPGLSPYLTDNADFYRIDIALRAPRVAVDDYRLRIHGLVREPVEIDYQDLLAMPLVERRVTLACVSNPVGGSLVDNATWTGVRIADLLDRAGVLPEADAVLSSGEDGITIGTPLSALTDGRDALVAVAMNGEPLPVDHGFPARMVVPGLYGYVSATKWVTDLEVTRFADVEAYWTSRGWSERGPVKTGGRIDVPISGEQVDAGDVVVAGVVWAQHRGIDEVRIRVDDGDWQPVELAAEDSVDTWRQWRWLWRGATPGEHRLQIRARDADGAWQPEEPAPPAPDGAQGYPTRTVVVG